MTIYEDLSSETQILYQTHLGEIITNNNKHVVHSFSPHHHRTATNPFLTHTHTQSKVTARSLEETYPFPLTINQREQIPHQIRISTNPASKDQPQTLSRRFPIPFHNDVFEIFDSCCRGESEGVGGGW